LAGIHQPAMSGVLPAGMAGVMRLWRFVPAGSWLRRGSAG
jgi:hypothetical protein